MRVTITNDDSVVYVDNISISDLDLSTTGIPSNVHALQWRTDSGWIEYKGDDYSKPPNESITELPEWADNCVAVFTAKKAELDAKAEAEQARIAAILAALPQPSTTGTQTI